MDSITIVNMLSGFLPFGDIEENTVQIFFLPTKNSDDPWVSLKFRKNQWILIDSREGFTRLHRPEINGDWIWIA